MVAQQARTDSLDQIAGPHVRCIEVIGLSTGTGENAELACLACAAPVHDPFWTIIAPGMQE